MSDMTLSPGGARPDDPAPGNQDSRAGFYYALAAYLFWGVLPLYMKLLSHVPPVEILAHRVLWSLPIAIVVLIWLGRTEDLRRALVDPRMLWMGALCAALISVNWGVYLWAITTDHALDAALGYYINPLFSVLLGRILLKERLRPAQWLAIGLAAAAVGLLTWDSGRLPVVALMLTLSWGLYAYFKKSLPIGPNQGFALEVAILAPFCVAYLVWITVSGGGSFFLSGTNMALLIGTGFATALPLMVYANGAKRLRLTTIGMMQYIAPTMIFLIAVFIFGEPLGHARAIAFPMIWLALVIYTLPMLRARVAR